MRMGTTKTVRRNKNCVPRSQLFVFIGFVISSFLCYRLFLLHKTPLMLV